jgi:hypothetical protein
VSDIARVQSTDEFVDGPEQFESLLRDVRPDHATIRPFVPTADETAVLEPVEEPCDIGVQTEESLTDIPAP